MTQANVRLSVRTREGAPTFDPDARFHVYFPTEEPSGFGVTVHGDFYVKPDRTRLMPGAYNEWLMDVAGRLLLEIFCRSCCGTMKPNACSSLCVLPTPLRTPAADFGRALRRAFQKRKEPFIPSTQGPLPAPDVGLPTSLDQAGFWSSHFEKIVGERHRKDGVS